MSDNKNNIPDDVLAAISMALYDLQDEVHDKESNVLTIKRVSQPYYPWCDRSTRILQIPTKK